eukprot:SAG31_NODE_642_length_13301_cov_14.143084_5_plen_77_part_00
MTTRLASILSVINGGVRLRRLDAGKRGEGLNLADFGADQYGPAFTVETGLFLPFQSRVRTAKLVAQTLVDVFARRY